MFDQSGEKYSWWSFRAASRARNVGWRIDYHWVSEPLRERVSAAKILNEVVHSDHCPVSLEVKG
jgi:exodeoxyribonuclease-3